MIQKQKKPCLCYKDNPNCEKEFWVEPKHIHSRVLCHDCKRLETQERKSRRQKERNLEKRKKTIKELEFQAKVLKEGKKKAALKKRIKIMRNYI